MIRKNKNLDAGSIVFFAPWRSLNVKYVLKVNEKVDALSAEGKLSKEWASFHKKEVTDYPKHKHSKAKKPLPRDGDIVIGSASTSFSLGSGKDVKERLEPRMSHPQRNNGMWFRDSAKAEELYRWLWPQRVRTS